MKKEFLKLCRLSSHQVANPLEKELHLHLEAVSNCLFGIFRLKPAAIAPYRGSLYNKVRYWLGIAAWFFKG